jgi:hypothetical protein
MEPIEYKWGPYKILDHAGKERWSGTLTNGKKVSRARLLMMNFLHCKNIPIVFEVHHINEETTDDRIDNLQLMSRVEHRKLHMPRDYSKYGVSSSGNPAEYQKARKNDPDKKEFLLAKRRKYYQDHLKNDPIYITKNRKRASDYQKNKKGGSNEISTL